MPFLPHKHPAVVVAAILVASVFSRAQAQLIPRPAPPFSAPAREIRREPLLSDDDRSGPRVGAAYIVGGSVAAEEQGIHVSPLMTLFGWQIEHEFSTGIPTSAVPMTELVMLVGGMEQGAFLPSVSWMLGLRQPNGWEAGIGPTLTGAGIQLAAAGGITRRIGAVNIPVNLAVAPGRRGASISLTTGFNTGRR